MKSLRQSAYVSYRFSFFSRLPLIAALLCALTTAAAHGQTVQLISDGGFEQGGAGWQLDTEDPSLATWFIDDVGSNTPVHGNPTSANGGGQGLYLVSAQVGSADTVLFQRFFVPPPVGAVILSFDMFVNDFSGLGDSLTTQFARVDILASNANPLSANSPVLFNAYLGTDGGPLPNDFTHYEFDITTFVPQSGVYQIRFLQQNTVYRDAFNQGVDNVSITMVPEPNTLCLAGFALTMLPLRRRRRRPQRIETIAT